MGSAEKYITSEGAVQGNTLPLEGQCRAKCYLCRGSAGQSVTSAREVHGKKLPSRGSAGKYKTSARPGYDNIIPMQR